MGLHSRNDDPQTSKDAEAQLDSEPLLARALLFLEENDRLEGWTQYEVELEIPNGLGISPQKRLGDLRRLGFTEWVRDSEGKIITRPGATNRRQGASRIIEGSKRPDYVAPGRKITHIDLP